jgi:hypothetical protein
MDGLIIFVRSRKWSFPAVCTAPAAFPFSMRETPGNTVSALLTGRGQSDAAYLVACISAVIKYAIKNAAEAILAAFCFGGINTLTILFVSECAEAVTAQRNSKRKGKVKQYGFKCCGNQTLH